MREYENELKKLREILVSGYIDPKTEASIIRRIELIEYKLMK